MLQCKMLLVAIALLLLTRSVEITAYAQQRQLNLQYAEALFGQPLQRGELQSDAAAPDTNSSQTLLDLNYWDRYEIFSPSSIEYDEFDWNFMKRVASSVPGNMLISPLSVKLTLSILKEAATGQTASEIERVLGLPPVRSDVRAKFGSIIGSLQTKSDKYVLDLGSRIYLGKGVVVRQRFSAIAEEFYKTEIKNTDFDHPQVATDDINGWVSSITHNKIQKLLSEDEVNDAIMMVLNAIYFKGTWRKQFSDNQTQVDHFTYENFQQVAVPYMNIEEKFFFCKSDTLDATILRLPYRGLKFAMYIILPNTITGVNRVLAHLSSSQLRSDILLMREHLVRLSLPRFRFEYLVKLKGLLQDMGIRQAFDLDASFPGIARGQTAGNRLRVSAIKQKAGIEVNEQGSEAYAATELTLVNKFGQADEDVVIFKVDKPFVFFIEDENTRQVLFAGKIADPLTPVGSLQPA